MLGPNLYSWSSRIVLSATNLVLKRNASKKAGTSSRPSGNTRAKHRGIRCQDGHLVTEGTLLVAQNKLRAAPGLNVGFGRNGNLFALVAGRVLVTCERADPNWDHTWNLRRYSDSQRHDVIYRKYWHVLPTPQHCRFKLTGYE